MNVKEYYKELYGDLRPGVVFSDQNMVDFAEGYAKYCVDNNENFTKHCEFCEEETTHRIVHNCMTCEPNG